MQKIRNRLLNTVDRYGDAPFRRRTFRVASGRAALALLIGCAAAGSVLGNPALEGYADYAAFRAQVDELEESDVCSVSSLGKTLGGRDVLLLTIGTGAADEKPALLIVGNVHEPLLAGSELAIRIAQRLTATV